jgi:RNA polymerase sigma-70 factor (ECF subfamily)
VEQLQDSLVIKKVLEGDRDAYAFLVDKYKTMVYTLALQITKDREEAEEVAQETFIKAYRSLKNFQGKARFSSWLYRIVYNTAISNLRRRKKAEISIDETDVPDTAFEEGMPERETLSGYERKKYLELAMDSLEPDERIFIILYYYEERALDEIAQIAGITKTNTKVRLFRARKKMLATLEHHLKEEKYSLL